MTDEPKAQMATPVKAWITRWHAKRCSKGHHVFGQWVFGNKYVCRHCEQTVRHFP